MPRLAYVNGRLLPEKNASVPVNDRGFLFADGVYEVAAILNGRLFDWDGHLARLARSLAELSMAAPMADAPLTIVARRLIRKTRVRDGTLYLQVTRGSAARDHAFPANISPNLVMNVRPFDYAVRKRQQREGVKAITLPDQRWARRDIKAVALLPNVLAKQKAREAGAFEAVMYAADGTITEGSSTNVWIVNAGGEILTRPLSSDLLAGVMRATSLRLLTEDGAAVRETAFGRDEMTRAREVFLTSTTSFAMPVIEVDGERIGSGRPGPVAARLAALLWEEVRRQTSR